MSGIRLELCGDIAFNIWQWVAEQQINKIAGKTSRMFEQSLGCIQIVTIFGKLHLHLNLILNKLFFHAFRKLLYSYYYCPADKVFVKKISNKNCSKSAVKILEKCCSSFAWLKYLFILLLWNCL